mmetsp:Transcript_4888/g.4138  ORF Transcript_4888/g.4138 Transcript_4888/m.4138 type:complete len:84 (+) Transcript_4888:393-644(+)
MNTNIHSPSKAFSMHQKVQPDYKLSKILTLHHQLNSNAPSIKWHRTKENSFKESKLSKLQRIFKMREERQNSCEPMLDSLRLT